MNSLHALIRGWLTATALVLLNPAAVGQTIPPPADDGTKLTLVRAGATWRYYAHDAEVGAGWRLPGFDDTQWGAGPAQLGYGDGDEATVVSSGPDSTQKRITTYFRGGFNLADPAQVNQLTMRLLRDDGAVVYLNGQEVVRDNMPAGPISAQTLAAATAVDENQFHEFVLAPGSLVSGHNVVAVEVHQVNSASSDMSFDLELSARDDEIAEASVVINEPDDGTTFGVGEEIRIRATAIDPHGFIDHLEFLDGGQVIGESGLFFIPEIEPGTPAHHVFEWKGASQGSHVLTARASLRDGTLVQSPAVNIVVGTVPATDRELHVVGIYSGTAADGGVSNNNEQGDASVLVNRPAKRVTLVLNAYEPVRWHVTLGEGTLLEEVILGGYYLQEVEGVPPGVTIVPAYSQGGGDYLYTGYTINAPRFYQAVPKLCALTGLDISSFQGGYQAPFPAQFVIDRVQDDVRLRCDYPQPVPPTELPNLNFRLSFHNLSDSGDVFFQNYTLGGPEDGQRLLPAARVIADNGGRFYYGTESQSVFKVDSLTGAAQEMVQPPDLAREGWPMGAAFDTVRQRVLVVSLGAEGFLHAYSPAQDTWSRITSMNNLDLDCLEYHPRGDALYGVSVAWGDYGTPLLYRFSADGALRGQLALPLQPFGIGPTGYRSELVSVGDYLVLLLEPSFAHNNGEVWESRMYLIDPRSEQVWLTYRRAGSQPNRPPVVSIVTPTDGTRVEAGATVSLGADVTDADGNLGAVTKVEFFANGGKIGEAMGPTTAPIRWTFAWTNVTSAEYTLTARASDIFGATAVSPPVHITVEPPTPPNQNPTVTITRPTGGSTLPVDTPIEIVAAARDADGSVRSIEFFADGGKIGEAGTEIQPPAPGQAQTFKFVWRQPPPGPHTLLARAMDDRGAFGSSLPIAIQVGTSEAFPTVIVTARDSFAVEPRADGEINTAAFRIYRYGAIAEPLVVAYSLGGSATNGADYQELSGVATISAGMRSVEVVVRPLADTLSEGAETVVLQLKPPPPSTPEIPVINPYRIGRPWVAAAVISDTPWAPAPGAAQCELLPQNLMHLCFAAETGNNYRVEASADLRNWETLSDTVSTDGALHFVDTEMQNQPFRFYRLVPAPGVP